MLRAGIYPITIAEMGSYQKDADVLFKGEEHERLKEFLALHPEFGDVLPDTGDVRLLRWPIKDRGPGPRVRVIYYFRDLNMPLYLIALYAKGERMKIGAAWRAEMKALVCELIAHHSKVWARVIGDQGST